LDGLWLHQHTMKHGILFIVIAIVTLVVVVTLVLNVSTRHTFRMLSQDAVGGPQRAGGPGISFSMKTWVSSDCVEISEREISYLSQEDTHIDFEEELKQVETIVDQSVTPTYRRVVGRARLHGYDKVRILTLSDKEIHRIEAHSLQCGLAFEKSGHSSTPSNKRLQLTPR
jgi:hypothetical protein